MTAKKRRGLGNQGVDVLLSAAQTSRQSADDSRELSHIPVESIRRSPYQPRQHIDDDALAELANSIRTQGLVQPVVVRPAAESQMYELIAGERRWRAAQLAGLTEVPAVIRAVSDQGAAAMSLIENIQREDLRPLEEAGAIQRLIERFGLTHQQVAESVGRSRAGVSNLLRLLELGDETRQLLDAGEMEMGHARALLRLTGLEQTEAAREIARKGLSVRAAEQLINQRLQAPATRTRDSKDPDLQRLERSLGDALGARIDIQQKNGGRGKMVIHYNSLDELDGVLAKLGHEDLSA